MWPNLYWLCPLWVHYWFNKIFYSIPGISLYKYRTSWCNMYINVYFCRITMYMWVITSYFLFISFSQERLFWSSFGRQCSLYGTKHGQSACFMSWSSQISCPQQWSFFWLFVQPATTHCLPSLRSYGIFPEFLFSIVMADANYCRVHSREILRSYYSMESSICLIDLDHVLGWCISGDFKT